jgi:hypothetical protein
MRFQPRPGAPGPTPFYFGSGRAVNSAIRGIDPCTMIRTPGAGRGRPPYRALFVVVPTGTAHAWFHVMQAEISGLQSDQRFLARKVGE